MLSKEKLSRCIKQAKGEAPAELVLKNCKIINTFTRELIRADVAICEELIVGTGRYKGIQEIDCHKYFVSPGFIEGHIHIESSMLSPAQFVYAVLPSGTTTVVCDPHEIANVAGVEGVKYILEETYDLPVAIFVMAPSCVPATHLETSGAILDRDHIAELLKLPRVIGLAEMMNFPGLLAGDEQIIEKLLCSYERKRPIDGHAPGLSGKGLQAYIAAGIGSDHECTTAEEGLEKLRAGMFLFIREGSVARNLEALLPVVNEKNVDRCLLVTDDCHPSELQKEGHIDRILRKAIRLGLDPFMAIQMVTMNVARYFHLFGRGAIGPGYLADMVLFEDLQDIRPCHVFTSGRQSVEDGHLLNNTKKPSNRAFPAIFQSVQVKWEKVQFTVPARVGKIRVIRVIKNQILTEVEVIEPTVKDGQVIADSKRDIAKIAVIERHHRTGNMGLGFVMGLGIQHGALAGSIAHDSHNIIVIGMSDQDMELAARSVAMAGGGLAVVVENRVVSLLQLDVAGLMATCSLREMNSRLSELHVATQSLGVHGENPFMLMSFLALPVIPHLKITDYGLVDVDAFKLVGLWV
jgi:adenine deaminase